jgi:hypothetical protein
MPSVYIIIFLLGICKFATPVTILSNACADVNCTQMGVKINTTSQDFFTHYYAVFQMSDGSFPKNIIYIFAIYLV